MKLLHQSQAGWIAASLMFVFSATTAIADVVSVRIKPLQARVAAPAFALRTSTGQSVDLSQYRGKVTLLNFWATECGGCRIEIPTFVSVEKSFENNAVSVVGVAMDVWFEQLKSSTEAWKRVDPFVAANWINYTMLMGDDAIKRAYNITELPVTVLIDKSGRVAGKYVGIVDKGNLESNVHALLADK